MDTFDGFEPQVGEIRALRTFRIGPGGVLYPLFSDHAWGTGDNLALCKLKLGPRGEVGAHPAPDPDCSCGFYAFADEPAASEYPNGRHVLAVVACWGRVIAGTLGVRAQHARVDALWMSDAVPRDLAALVADRYPAASIHTTKEQMLAQHPLTLLDCYRPVAAPPSKWQRIAFRIAVATALLLGLLPTTAIWTNSDAYVVWGLEFAFFVVGALVLSRRRDDLAASRRSLLFGALALWLLAPVAGSAGTFLLRLPLIQIVVISSLHRRVLERAARKFPAPIGKP